MDEDQVRVIARIVAEEIGMQNHCEFCENDERRKHHRQEHEFIQGLMGIAEKWDGVKWELLRDVMKWVSRVVIMATITGLIILAVKSGGVSIK